MRNTVRKSVPCATSGRQASLSRPAMGWANSTPASAIVHTHMMPTHVLCGDAPSVAAQDACCIGKEAASVSPHILLQPGCDARLDRVRQAAMGDKLLPCSVGAAAGGCCPHIFCCLLLHAAQRAEVLLRQAQAHLVGCFLLCAVILHATTRTTGAWRVGDAVLVAVHPVHSHIWLRRATPPSAPAGHAGAAQAPRLLSSEQRRDWPEASHSSAMHPCVVFRFCVCVCILPPGLQLHTASLTCRLTLP